MFQRLDQLRTGSLFIITGQAGAGKSHLAASARRGGTVWVLDTEGAAQNLLGKPGIHREIQAVQTLSLRQLLDAMREIKRVGRPGDTVILDSISKVLQAMRSYAQQRAGAETDRKAAISYDEHASVNRNMQAIYTGLTELKQAGFHVIIIGHLAKKYQANGNALADVGLRVLADEHINYEADAILLVERNGARRTVTPIIKPPRQSHLQLNQEYPATLATLYPDLAVEEAVEAKVTPFPGDEARANGTPKNARDAERRFFARYGELIGGTSWADVEAFLGYQADKPATVQEWIDLAAEVRARAGDAESAAA
ncbi:AAA family ATPase [Kallotenue papyrolyticum]|uniref:AAA family ATPase n=1 Tax=Kallotenue papyrolyticum TaxID=1325125 RepID=UPI000492B9B0|nr:AAA family ATPase [Kallotenue papyrolyticum]